MRKVLCMLTLLLLSSVMAIAQPRVITGRVIDEKGEPVSGASILIKGTSTGASANAEGDFRITAKPGDVLEISATNFGRKEVRLTNQTSLSVTLTRAGQVIEEVVVTALGIQRQAKELGYSTARIRNTELTQAKTVNLQNGLTGKVSGLNITTTNSGVFADTKINLRGIRSLTGNNQPMLVIDGIPTPISYINSVNPNDIQDVSILKGASAAALYGPDGVNGVIIVTTKKGTRGKPTVTVSHTTQLETVAFMPKLQTQFGSGSSVDAYGNPEYTAYENQQYGPEFNGQTVDLGKPLADGSIQRVPYSALKNEKRKFWNTGLTLQNDVSFSTQDFYMSVQDVKIKGVMPNDENRRTTFRFNATKEYGKFKANFGLSYIQQNFDVVNEAAFATRYANTYSGSVYFTVLNTPMHVPLTTYKDWRNNKFASYGGYYNEYARNPYWVIDNHRQIGRNDDILGSMELNYKMFNWLGATYRLGTSLTFGQYKNQTYPIVSDDYAIAARGTAFANAPGSVGDGQSTSSRVNQELFLNGKASAGDFNFTYLAGTLLRENNSKQVNVVGNNLVVPALFNLSNRTGEITGNESNTRNRLVSAYGSFAISYKSYANIEVTARNDWDSRLRLNTNDDVSYFYPALNASLVLSDAIPALKNSNTISYAKVRGSISKSANVNLGTYALEALYQQGGGFPYGNLGGFTANNSTPDKGITPEFVKSTELGIELAFLKNRLNIEATFFTQDNTDQILNVSQSITTGFTTLLTNAASFVNRGVEVDVRLTPLFNLGKGRFDLKANASYNDNEVTSLYPGINELGIGGSAGFTQRAASSPDVSNFAIVGMPAFVFKLSDYKRDPQGRVIIDRNTGNPALSDSLVTRGRSLPLWNLGFNPSFSIGGLTISATLDYRGGHNAYFGMGSDMDFTGISERSARYGRQKFVFPNSVYLDNGKYVENTNITTSDGGINFYTSGALNSSVGTNYFTSAASWKLRELAISYELPNRWIGNGKVVKRAVISAVGRNLFIWLPKTNEWTDPEFNYTTTNNTFGISSSFGTPPTRIFGGSLTLTF